MQLECPVCMNSLFGPAQTDCSVPNCTPERLCNQCASNANSSKETPKKGRRPCVSNKFSKSTGLADTSATPCGHIFHSRCLKKWFAESGGKPSCPNCRYPFALTRIVQIYLDYSAHDSFAEDSPGTSAAAVQPSSAGSIITAFPQIETVDVDPEPEDIDPSEYNGNNVDDLKMIHKTLISDFNDLKRKYLELKDEDDFHRAQILSLECEMNSLQEEVQLLKQSRAASASSFSHQTGSKRQCDIEAAQDMSCKRPKSSESSSASTSAALGCALGCDCE